ncbi:AAA family ATPase [Candidatus Saccharibacteria bacterium]|nr:AAA family ATPase [Candidatus Saccharibacteria bacterium]
MIELLLHPKTKSSLEAYLKAPSQVLVIVGAKGSGKKTLSRIVALKLLGVSDVEKLENEPRLMVIRKEDGKSEIAIETVRRLIRSLRVKQPGESGLRIIIIEEANLLSQEAQNALLKTLEQPAGGTLFILTSDSLSQILPTVLSRSQKLSVYPISEQQALKNYQGSYEQDQIRRAWMLSEGAAENLHKLLDGEEEQPLIVATDNAKEFLAASPYQRLTMADALSKDKQRLLNLLEGLSRILKALHHSNIKRGSNSVATRLLTARKLVSQSQEALDGNASPKLVLLKLILNLKV